MNEEARFHWADYVVFGSSLLLSASVGIYFGYVDRKHNSTEEFLMAGRSMSALPVSLSLFVSWMSAISFLGDPVEAYTFGAIYWIIGFGYCLGIPIVAHVFAPYYHSLNIVSAYELLERKYNRALRLMATTANIVTLLLWLGVVLFAPALALSQSSGLPVWVAMVCITVVCIFYTTLGGMKAVLWTDTLQMVVMLAGQLAIVIQGCIKVGGVNKLFSVLSETGHTRINNFNPSPFGRVTFWAFLIGGMFRVFNPYICNQMLVQRYCTVKSKKTATIAVYMNIPIYLLMSTLFTATGLVMAAVYAGCDPLTQGRISHPNQMVPLLVLELLGFVPGIPGLFMSCVFSASLSSLSSAMNSLSANTLKDFIEPAFECIKKKQLDDRSGTIIAKSLVVLYGVIVLGMGFTMMSAKGSIFALTLTAVGMVASPMAGIFCVAVLFPNVKTKSVTIAFLISLTICLWWGVGAFFLPKTIPPEALTVSVESCDVANGTFYTYANSSDVTTMSALTTEEFQTQVHKERFTVEDLYHLNPLYYGPLGCLGTIILSLIFHGFGLAWDSLRSRKKVYAMTDEKLKMDSRQAKITSDSYLGTNSNMEKF